ncbi:TNF receptor-associated factor 4-like [Dysidea avara]|uniref:TNF receptor-associated factor 4-like n=1 Tax=Dysidea avara TaxID=196820 RepID=UPI00332A1A97
MSAMETMGGYEYSFVELLPDELVCKICQYPVRDPLLSECCGQNFCKSCLDIYADSNATFCPFCRRNNFNAFHDKRTERVVLSYHVSCSGEGCKWRGELRRAEEHEEYCDHVDIKCTNGCKESVKRRHMQDHCNKSCRLRQVVCQFCSTRGTAEFITSEHFDTCINVPIECPNHCGVDKMPRDDLCSHLELCPLERVLCDYSGCRTKLLRKQKEHHNCINAAHHLELVSQKLEQTQAEVKELKTSCANLTELVKVLISSHPSLPWSVRLLAECQLSMHGQCPFVVKVTDIGLVKYQHLTVYSNEFHSGHHGYQLRLSLNLSHHGNTRHPQLLLGWQLLPGDHNNHLAWPVNALIRLEVLNQLNDSHHVYCTSKVSHLQQVTVSSPKIHNIQLVNSRTTMNYSYVSDNVMYVRVVETTFEPIH